MIKLINNTRSQMIFSLANGSTLRIGGLKSVMIKDNQITEEMQIAKNIGHLTSIVINNTNTNTTTSTLANVVTKEEVKPNE